MLIVLVSLVSWLAAAALGMQLLRRLNFDTRLGARNATTAPAMFAATGINLAIALLVLGEYRLLQGPRPLSFIRGPIDLVAAVLVLALTFACALAWVRFGGAKRTNGNQAPRIVLAGALALLCAAFSEEVMFRGVILGALSNLSAPIAVSISTVIFTAVHVPTSRVTVHSVIAWALGGLAFAVMYAFGVPLLVLSCAHFVRNVCNVLFVDPSSELGLVSRVRFGPWARDAYYAVLSLGAVTTVLFYA